MKAIAVFPGKPNSVHLAELPNPSINDVPNGRGVLVKVLRVGVDGTDKEINAAEYGAAPQGYDFLVIGHESFGQVEAVGPHVAELRPGDYVVATVRRPGSSIYDKIGTYDMTTDDTYYERGINLRPEDSHNICKISIQRQEDSIKVLCLCNENGIKGTLQANAHAGVRLHVLPDGGLA